MPIVTRLTGVTNVPVYIYAHPGIDAQSLIALGWSVYMDEPVPDDVQYEYLSSRPYPPNRAAEALADWERELLDAGTAPAPEPAPEPSRNGWYFIWHPTLGYWNGYLREGQLDDYLARGYTTDIPDIVCEWCQCEEQPHDTFWNLCQSCADEARTCADCGFMDHHDNMYWSERHDADYCPDCYPRCTDDALEDYGYKPEPVFHTMDGTYDNYDLSEVMRTAPFMGFELEMECRGAYTVNEAVETVSAKWGSFAYCKHDGSLENGLELVTHPFTLEYAHNCIDWSLLDRLRNMEFRSWNTRTAGMHVHVNRATFTGQAHLYRFAQLVYKNEPTCKAFAGRDSEYASFADGYQKGHLAKIVKGECRSNRGAVNMLNASTIEVRIFRGSLKPQRVLANLEFVHAAVEYTRTIPVRDVVQGGLSWRAFATWILDNRTTYPHLFSYLDLNPTAPNKTHDPAYTSY